MAQGTLWIQMAGRGLFETWVLPLGQRVPSESVAGPLPGDGRSWPTGTREPPRDQGQCAPIQHVDDVMLLHENR